MSGNSNLEKGTRIQVNIREKKGIQNQPHRRLTHVEEYYELLLVSKFGNLEEIDNYLSNCTFSTKM